MATLRQIEIKLDSLSRRLDVGVSTLIRPIAVGIGRALARATPVDTGFALGNWRPAINAPATVPVSILDPSGESTVAKIETIAKRFRAGDSFFIVNNAPYITALDRGHSPQAPPGFIADSVRRGEKAGMAAFRRSGGFVVAFRRAG